MLKAVFIAGYKYFIIIKGNQLSMQVRNKKIMICLLDRFKHDSKCCACSDNVIL